MLMALYEKEHFFYTSHGCLRLAIQSLSIDVLVETLLRPKDIKSGETVTTFALCKVEFCGSSANPPTLKSQDEF